MTKTKTKRPQQKNVPQIVTCVNCGHVYATRKPITDASRCPNPWCDKHPLREGRGQSWRRGVKGAWSKR
jgi:predicted Zn-ribbon and HTH transcriptional regulator